MAHHLVPRLESLPGTPGAASRGTAPSEVKSVSRKTWLDWLPYPSGFLKWLYKMPILEANPHITIQTWRGTESVLARRITSEAELTEAFIG